MLNSIQIHTRSDARAAVTKSFFSLSTVEAAYFCFCVGTYYVHRSHMITTWPQANRGFICHSVCCSRYMRHTYELSSPLRARIWSKWNLLAYLMLLQQPATLNCSPKRVHTLKRIGISFLFAIFYAITALILRECPRAATNTQKTAPLK